MSRPDTRTRRAASRPGVSLSRCVRDRLEAHFGLERRAQLAYVYEAFLIEPEEESELE